VVDVHFVDVERDVLLGLPRIVSSSSSLLCAGSEIRLTITE